MTGFKHFLLEYESIWSTKPGTLNKLLKMERDVGVMKMANDILAWFDGFMMSRISDTRVQQLAVNLKKFPTYYKVTAPANLYRSSVVAYPGSDKKLLTQSRFITGDKPVQSWTEDPNVAAKFYQELHANLNHKKDRRYAWVVLKTHRSNVEPILNWESAYQFVSDLVNLYDDLVDHGCYMLMRGMVTQQPHEIGTNFIKNQREVTCIVPQKIDASVYQILHSAETQ